MCVCATRRTCSATRVRILRRSRVEYLGGPTLATPGQETITNVRKRNREEGHTEIDGEKEREKERGKERERERDRERQRDREKSDRERQGHSSSNRVRALYAPPASPREGKEARALSGPAFSIKVTGSGGACSDCI